MNKLILSLALIAPSLIYSAAPAANQALMRAEGRLPKHIHDLHRHVFIARMLEAWRADAAPYEKRADDDASIQKGTGEQLEYDQYVPILLIDNGFITELPQKFYTLLPDSCWAHLDLRYCKLLSEEAKKRVAQAWVAEKRYIIDLVLPANPSNDQKTDK